MKSFDLLIAKKYALLKLSIILTIVILITITNLLDFYFFSKSSTGVIFDLVFYAIIALIFLFIIFKRIDKRENIQERQIDQLCDAYQYIGQMNRKIDALLELDIASLDQSKHVDIYKNSEKIFNQLFNVIKAEMGCLYFRPPLDFSIYLSKNNEHKYKKEIESLSQKEIDLFKFSNGEENEEFFSGLGLDKEIIDKYTIVTKPIYMHQQNIGLMVLLFKKNQQLEDRDLNIIRVFSFYLALVTTFKPDFSLYQNIKKLEN